MVLYREFIRMDGSFPGAKEEEEAKLAKELPPPRLRVTRLVIMAMLVMLVGLLTVSTWYFAYSSPRLAVVRLTESLRKEILDSTVKFLDEVLRWNAYGAKALAGMLQKDLVGDGSSLDSFAKIRAASFSLFKAIPLITSIGATSVNGLSGLYVRGGLKQSERISGNSPPIYIYSKSTEKRPTFYIEAVNMTTGDAVGDPIQYNFQEHLKSREWFSTALAVPIGEASWHLSISQISGRPYIQCAIPVLCPNAQQTTVVHCSHSANAITKYLTNNLDLKGGNVFVLNDLGEVLFTSEGDDCLYNTSQSSGCKYQSDVAGALKFMESQIPLAQLIQEEIHYTDMLLGGRRYFLDSWPHSFQGVKLAVVILMPRHSFWGPMDYHARIAWIAIPLLALGVSFVGCFLIFLLMEQVAADMKLRAELQRQLEAKRRAEASRDAKTAFLSHMSHELRTPMACIIGLLDILMGELKMSEHQSSVRQVHRCATSLVSLLNSALDIAKVEAGKLVLEIAEFDLEAELTSLIEVFSVQCDVKGLHLSLQLSDEIPKLVNGDPARVLQIFTNLIGNSIKFTSRGRILVRGWVDNTEAADYVTTTSRNGRNQVVLRFEVDDSGPGIEKALRERVFENFVQGAISTPRTHGGTGLGLGIVRSLVHLMGGTIKIGDKTSDGTLFQFSLCFELPPGRSSFRHEVMKRREIILAMPDKDCSSIVAEWMEDRRLTVHQVNSLGDIFLQLEDLGKGSFGTKLNKKTSFHKEDLDSESNKSQISLGRASGLGRRTRSDTRLKKPVLIIDVDAVPHYINESEYLQAFEKLGLILRIPSAQSPDIPDNDTPKIHVCKSAHFYAVIWVVASNTCDQLKNALALLSRSTSRSILVRRPLHPTRLRELFTELEAREQNFQEKDRSTQRQLTSASHVNIAKQFLVEPCNGDDSPGIVNGIQGYTLEAKECSGNEEIQSMEKKLDENAPVVPNRTKDDVPQPVRHIPLVRSNSDDSRSYLMQSEMLLASKPLQNLNVLVAEDHVLLRMLATTLLQKLGATPLVACNGQEAVNLVISRFESGLTPFHCILMDCQMPVMNGYDACNAIREFERGKDQRTCVIALTANAMASDEKRCFLVGMDAFLTKPIEQDRLVQVILSSLTTPDAKSLGTSATDKMTVK